MGSLALIVCSNFILFLRENKRTYTETAETKDFRIVKYLLCLRIKIYINSREFGERHKVKKDG